MEYLWTECRILLHFLEGAEAAVEFSWASLATGNPESIGWKIVRINRMAIAWGKLTQNNRVALLTRALLTRALLTAALLTAEINPK